MLEPKRIPLTLADGTQKEFILTKFPAVAGREIVTKYPLSNVPKIGEYQQSEEVMLKLMAYVAVVPESGEPLLLNSRALVDNHVGDWESLMKLEWAQLEYNVSFFGQGKSLDFLGSLSQTATTWITKTLMPSLVASLKENTPPSGNSKPSTPSKKPSTSGK